MFLIFEKDLSENMINVTQPISEETDEVQYTEEELKVIENRIFVVFSLFDN